MAELEGRNTHKLYEKEMMGEVRIADEVVAIIAGLAATEVDGVDSMAGNITNELVGKLGMKNLSKGVKVDVTEEHVSVDLSLNIKYGYNIPDVSERVQDRVKSRPENMTGLTVLWSTSALQALTSTSSKKKNRKQSQNRRLVRKRIGPFLFSKSPLSGRPNS